MCILIKLKRETANVSFESFLPLYEFACSQMNSLELCQRQLQHDSNGLTFDNFPCFMKASKERVQWDRVKTKRTCETLMRNRKHCGVKRNSALKETSKKNKLKISLTTESLEEKYGTLALHKLPCLSQNARLLILVPKPIHYF